jgi:hypothetical protein
MKNPKKEQFELKKIKLTNGGGLTIAFNLTETVGEEIYRSSQDVKSSKEPHPDLRAMLGKMRPMVGQILHHNTTKSVVNEDRFHGDKAQLKMAEKAVEVLNSKIEVTGVSISGEGDKRGCVITSVYTVDNGQKIALNTPRIILTAETRGFEEELEKLVNDLENEAYEFVYNAKIANPEMFEYDEE